MRALESLCRPQPHEPPTRVWSWDPVPELGHRVSYVVLCGALVTPNSHWQGEREGRVLSPPRLHSPKSSARQHLGAQAVVGQSPVTW